jgi:hypothetical protein
MRGLNGEVAEWPKAHAWKVCNGQPFEGSNPSLTANSSIVLFVTLFILNLSTLTPDCWH